MSTLPNIAVTVAPSSRMLCQRGDVKTELSITGSGDDSKIDRLIAAFSLYAAGPEGLRREPWLQTVLEKRPGLGGHYLPATYWPIQSVASVTEGTGASPTTVDSTTYSIGGRRRDRFYRVDGWARHSLSSPEVHGHTTGPQLAYNLTYTAGWVMPDQLTEWAASTAVNANEWYKATDVDEPFVFQAGGSGTTDSSEPTWPTVSGGTVLDNDVTWTAYDQRLPQDLEEAAIAQVMGWFDGLTTPSGIRSESYEGMRIDYATSEPAAISPSVAMMLRRYR